MSASYSDISEVTASQTFNEASTNLGPGLMDGKTVTGLKQPTQSILASDFDKQSQMLVARSILNFKAKNVKSKRLKITEDEPDEKVQVGNQAGQHGVDFS